MNALNSYCNWRISTETCECLRVCHDFLFCFQFCVRPTAKSLVQNILSCFYILFGHDIWSTKDKCVSPPQRVTNEMSAGTEKRKLAGVYTDAVAAF